MLKKLALVAAVALGTVTVAAVPAAASGPSAECITCWPVDGVGGV